MLSSFKKPMKYFGVYRAFLILSLVQGVKSNISWDPECGISKGCFPNCRSQGCQYLVTWQKNGSNSLQFTMKLQQSPAPGYLAVGFTDDYRMGDDSVVGCVISSRQCYSSYNSGTDSSALSPPSAGILSSSVSQSNDIISCNFTRQFALSTPNSEFFDIKQNKYILMFLYGKAKKDKKSSSGFQEIGKHTMIPFASDVKVDFTANKIYNEQKLNTPVIKLHGMVMTTAWLLFSCIGIITARYNRLLLKRHKVFGTQIWFQIHRAIMVVVIALTVIGFISIFVEIGGYSQLNPPSNLSVTSSHPVLGIIVMSLAILNTIGGIARPDNEHQWRWLFNWVHFIAGVVTQLLAVSTVLIGYQMQRASLPMHVLYIGIAQLVITLIMCGIKEIHRWRIRKTQESTYNSLSDPFFFNFSKTVSEVYSYILIGYTALMVILTLVNLGIIGAS